METLRRLRGLDEARRVLLAQRGIEPEELPPALLERTRRMVGDVRTAQEAVERIVAAVRERGDEAVRELTRAFDGVELGELRVSQGEIDAAARRVPPKTYRALEAAAERIQRFHARAKRLSWIDFTTEGGALGQLIIPIERVGVAEVVLVSPPGPDGSVADVLLAAARVAGIDAVYRVGGAQAVAALAFGTASIPRVDKIVGPGNLFVVLAKQLVYGRVGIDGLPGPTECLIVADDSASPRYLAADFLAQAEHDPLASPVLIVTSEAVAEAALAEARVLLAAAPRRAIIEQSLAARGAVVVVDSVEEAIQLANEFAPEHLALCVRDAFDRLGLVRNAGGVFVGELSAESVGDYTAGPSHIMPTGGTARFASPLSVDDFVKITSVFSFGRDELARIGPPAIELARAEGLEAHARAIEVRLEDGSA
jgi:histidinol dehydrogenase